MKSLLKKYAAVSAIVLAGGLTTAAHAADSVNVAFSSNGLRRTKLQKSTKLMTTPWVLMSNGLIFQQVCK